MTTKLIPLNDKIFVSDIAGKNIRQISPNDLSITDQLLCFNVDTLTPNLKGSYQFVGIKDIKPVKNLVCKSYSINFKSDGPEINIPENFISLSDKKFDTSKTKTNTGVYLFHSSISTEIPIPFGFKWLNLDKKLTPQLAFILGAFAVRPQFYFKDGKTWIIIGSSYQENNKLKLSPSKKTEIVKDHFYKIQKIVEHSWKPEEYYIQIKNLPTIKLTNPLPPGFEKDIKLKSANCKKGFSFHLPINYEDNGNSTGKADDKSLRAVQFWYSCILHHLKEIAPITVKKSFVIGAFDLSCNLDNNRTFGIDWPEKYEGVYPLFTNIAELLNDLLDISTNLTQNPRRESKSPRIRGRMLRAPMDEYLHNLGFLCLERYERAYHNIGKKHNIISFPYIDILSVLFETTLYKFSTAINQGSDENDLNFRKIYDKKTFTTKEFLEIELVENFSYPICSLPIGSLNKKTPKIISKITTSIRKLDTHNYEQEILEFIHNIGDYVSLKSKISADLVFEYLVALLFSNFKNVSEAWVINRSDDEGIDSGCKMVLSLNNLEPITIINQAKLQKTTVGRRVIDQLRGAIGSKYRDQGSVGYVITTNKFSSSAKRSSKDDFPKIHLIDGKSLVDLLIDHKIGFIKKGSKFFADINFFDNLIDTIDTISTKKIGKIFIKFDNGKISHYS